MDSIKDLSKHLSKSRKLSKQIIDYAIPIMKNIDNKDEDFLEDLNEKFPNVPTQKLFAIMKRTILELVRDPECLLKEVEEFSDILIKKGTEDIYAYVNKSPFLVGVWSGDVYDKDGIASLIDLNKDFKNKAIVKVRKFFFLIYNNN
jgi:hypothetical protein